MYLLKQTEFKRKGSHFSFLISSCWRPRIWDQLKLRTGSIPCSGRRPGNTLHILGSSKPHPPLPFSQEPRKTNEDWWLLVRARLKYTTTKEITVGIRGFPREHRGGGWWLWGKSSVIPPPCRKCRGQRRLFSPDVTRMRSMYPECMTPKEVQGIKGRGRCIASLIKPRVSHQGWILCSE